MYCAAIAVLTEAGKVTKWVLCRDLRQGCFGKGKVVETYHDPYWERTLKCTCLWTPKAAPGVATARPRPIDPHSGLLVAAQQEVLRCTRAAGVGSMPMPSWGVHRDRDDLEAVAEKLRHSNPPVATRLQA